jgi:undecaprenyl-diphosphatase
MSDAVKAIVLGIVEGLTEFLPVSSTAHLRIVEGMLGISEQDPYWKMFAIVIQLGAILSLFAYFGGRLFRLLRTFPKGEAGDRTLMTHPLTLVVVAFFVTAIPSKLLDKVIGENLENWIVIGGALVIGGVVMWVVDAIYGKRESGTRRVEDMSFVQATVVGAAQVLAAVFPGTSRSMATIAGAQVAGMSRPAALEFSFLLSIPTMVAATGYALLKAVKGSDTEGLARVEMDGQKWAVLGIGTVVSFIVALAVVAWFMGWVRKRGFVPFAIYRIIAGIAVLVWAMRAAG